MSIPVQAKPAIVPLAVEDVLGMQERTPYSSIILSPDGQLVAYNLQDPVKKRAVRAPVVTETGVTALILGSDLWVTDTHSGRSKNLTGGKGTSWGAAWSPDSNSLAFYSDRSGMARLWVWHRGSGSLRQVSEATIRSTKAWELQWSPDGKQILVRVLPEGMRVGTEPEGSEAAQGEARQGSAKASGLTVRVHRSFASETDGFVMQETYVDASKYLSDLALIDVASGRVDRIAEDVSSLGWAGMSPDGAHVAFMDYLNGRVPRTWAFLFDLKLVSLADRAVRTLAKDIPLGLYANGSQDISWSPNGRLLAYLSSDGPEPDNTFLASLSGDVRPVTEAPHPPFRGKPVWNDAGDMLYLISESALWRLSVADGSANEVAQLPGKTLEAVVSTSPNRDQAWVTNRGKSVVVMAKEGLKAGYYQVDLGTGKVKTLFEEEKKYDVDSIVASEQGKHILYLAEDVQRPEDLWIARGKLRESKQLTRANPRVSAAGMGARRMVAWQGRDGKQRQGLLLLPADYQRGKSYPMVVYVYAKSLRHANSFGFSRSLNMQLLANRGYAVFYPDVPIRTGEPMKGIADIVLPGIDKVVELGIADGNRIGVMGHSYGGYATLSLIVQSTRFKAAVDSAGPGNLLSGYGMSLTSNGFAKGVTGAEGNALGMSNHPWKAREQYTRNSPWFFLDKVETPLLILHGMEDSAVPVGASNEIFVGLRRLGKEAEYAQYAGEGHVLSGWANRVDMVNRYIDWFERYLK